MSEDDDDLLNAKSIRCPFCELSTDRLVDQDELTVTLRDGYPVSPGHSLIIPRRHVASWFDLDEAEQAALMKAVSRARARLDEELAPAGYNLGVNVGAVAGQTLMHVHVHLIPRYQGDVDAALSGRRPGAALLRGLLLDGVRSVRVAITSCCTSAAPETSPGRRAGQVAARAAAVA